MHPRIKHALTLSFVSTLAACSAQPGCSELDGLATLPEAFAQDKRIENAASLRIMDAGIALFEQRLGTIATNVLGQQGLVENGVLPFPISTTPVSGFGYDLKVCPDGPNPSTGSCIAEINVAAAAMSIRTEAPHDIVLEGSVPVRLTKLPITGTVALLPIRVDAAISGGGKDDCNPATMSFATVDVTARLSLAVERDTSHALRLGYSKLRVERLEIDRRQLTDSLHACGSGLDDGAVNTLKGAIAPLLMSGFQATMLATANQQLCIESDPDSSPSCPVGTSEQNGICVYADGTCASIPVGLEGHSDLGALLRGLSPGTFGGLDLLLAGGGPSGRPDDPRAAWGDLNPGQGGASLGLIGGAVPAPLTACVKPVQLQLPSGIPIPDELLGNAVDGWTGPGPHVGVAISERFLNYALGSAYNSGLMCIGLSTEQIARLSTGLFGLLVPSIKYLAHQKGSAPMAIVLRPQAPPAIALGAGTDLETDPFVRVKLERTMFDFYVWSSDRFIRAFTAQLDLDVPINLDISADGITPVLDKIHAKNPSVSNAELVREQPQKIADAFAGVVEGLAGQLFGDLQPFGFANALEPYGFILNVPATGIRRLQKDGDAFIGLFAGMDVTRATTSLQTDTTAQIVSVEAPIEAFRLSTATSATPCVVLRASSSAARNGQPVEYTYRLDRGAWRPWSAHAEITVTDPFLRMQGHHTVTIKSRVVGDPASEDPTPTHVSFTIDVDAPRVWLTERDDGRVRLEAHDAVSPADRLMYRTRDEDGAWSDWKRLRPRTTTSTAPDATQVSVEVRDEQGNVATVQQELIRGGPDVSSDSEGTGGSGCAMSASHAEQANSLALLGVLAGLGYVARRRARSSSRKTHTLRRVAAALAVTAVGGTWTGCNCADEVDDLTADDGTRTPPNRDQCGTWGAPACVKLLPGIIGSYTSAAVASDGTVWVAGYNEADWNHEVSYGDLVVGKLGDDLRPVWSSVDGIPTTPAPDETKYDLSSWRGGQDAAGDDVGLWTSLLLGPDGNPQVAYHDATNAALKFAGFDGSTWTIHTVYQRQDAEAGRYVKMVLVNGAPVVAFQVIEPSKGGYATSRVVLGRATKPTPSGAQDWTFEDVAVEEQTPCRAHLCPDGQACIAATLQCTQTGGACDPECGTGEVCVEGTCATALDGTKPDAYPDAIGGYISLAAIAGGDVGLVYYDRIHGNLVQARRDGSGWFLRVLDGEQEGSPAVDIGDMGAGASLFVDEPGNWHIAYVDGLKESLRYMLIEAGVTPHAPELVDDGTQVSGQAFEDGKHVVGDDASVHVTSNGEVRIAYQDATVGKLRYATGIAAHNGKRTWKLRQLEQPGFAGFFPKQLVIGNEVHVINWWRTGGQSIEGNVRVIKP